MDNLLFETYNSSVTSWSSPNSYPYAPWLTSGFLRERFFARAAERIILPRAIAYQLFGSLRRRQKRALFILSTYQQYLNIILNSH